MSEVIAWYLSDLIIVHCVHILRHQTVPTDRYDYALIKKNKKVFSRAELFILSMVRALSVGIISSLSKVGTL